MPAWEMQNLQRYETTQPDFSLVVHQCAQFQDSPKKSHAQVVWMIGRYLHGTCDKGITL